MGVTKVATRVSDFEDLETSLKSGSDWVWLDSFSGDWEYLKEAVPVLSKNGQRTCLVSPELQRPDSAPELKTLQEMIEGNSLEISSVCTKVPRNWEK
jgi:nicotinate-nucleotide pyrophosphorylase